MAKTSKYQQVTEWIQSRITAGELGIGDKLESEHEISTLFGISRQTVRHALSVLIKAGLLESVQGSGTYVRDPQAPEGAEMELSRTVTIISTYVDGYIFPGILQSMVRTLEQNGYGASIMFTNNRLETERQLLERILKEKSRNPLIVEPVMSGLPNPNLNYYRRIRMSGIPILFFHSFYPELDIPHIGMDDEQAGRMAAEYLISQGHRKIGGIFKADDGQGRRRYKGYLKALLHAGIGVNEERVCWIDTQEMKELPEVSPRIWKRLENCTACVCYNDEVAHVLTESAAGRNLRIPEDLSLVSFDNSDLARLNTVPLTSVAHPMELLGIRVAENIMGLIEKKDFDATFEFPVEMEIRSSVVPAGSKEQAI